MIEKKDCVKVGYVAKPHGVNGEVVLRAESGFSVDDLGYEFLFLELDGGLVPYYLDTIRPKNDEEAIVKLEFSDSKEDASRLTGTSVFVDRDWMDEQGDGEMTTKMLIGFIASDKTHGELGEIVEIDEQCGTNPLFVVQSGERQYLIPITDDFISDINVEKQIVSFDLPDGLVDI